MLEVAAKHDVTMVLSVKRFFREFTNTWVHVGTYQIHGLSHALAKRQVAIIWSCLLFTTNKHVH